MQFRDLTLVDAITVATHMRQEDRRCIHALMGDIEDESFAANRWGAQGPAWTLADDAGNARAIGGVQFVNDWTGIMWLVVTEGLPLTAWRRVLSLSRTVIANAMNPENKSHKHRIEASVIADWSGAQDLVRRLGFRHESTRRAAGKNQEDLQTWAITLGDSK